MFQTIHCLFECLFECLYECILFALYRHSTCLFQWHSSSFIFHALCLIHIHPVLKKPLLNQGYHVLCVKHEDICDTYICMYVCMFFSLFFFSLLELLFVFKHINWRSQTRHHPHFFPFFLFLKANIIHLTPFLKVPLTYVATNSIFRGKLLIGGWYLVRKRERNSYDSQCFLSFSFFLCVF